jgi:hypothetical protein
MENKETVQPLTYDEIVESLYNFDHETLTRIASECLLIVLDTQGQENMH